MAGTWSSLKCAPRQCHVLTGPLSIHTCCHWSVLETFSKGDTVNDIGRYMSSNFSNHEFLWIYIYGLVQERLNSIANALELSRSCTNPSIYAFSSPITDFNWIYALKVYIWYTQCPQSSQNHSSTFGNGCCCLCMEFHMLASVSKICIDRSTQHPGT